MLTAIVTTVLQVLQVKAGNGKHSMFVDYPKGVDRILKFLFASIISYNTSLTLTKISILLQYRRIFAVRELRIPLNVVMSICVVWGLVTVVSSIFACVPVSAYWHILERPKAKCVDEKIMWYTNAAVNIFTDLLLAFLPVRVIGNLHIARRQKIALVGILTIGWFVCVVSVLRLHALIRLQGHMTDNTYYSAPAAYWSNIEMNLAIVCASLPALKPLIVRIIPAFSSSHGGSNGYGSRFTSGGHTKRTETGHGVSSTARHTRDDGIELERSPGTPAPDKGSDGESLGKNIYVSRHFEQHYEDCSRTSDSESQKDLVQQH
ncbi:hypothetical protein ACJQWK_01837 [Exserohilum turcicum]